MNKEIAQMRMASPSPIPASLEGTVIGNTPVRGESPHSPCKSAIVDYENDSQIERPRQHLTTTSDITGITGSFAQGSPSMRGPPTLKGSTLGNPQTRDGNTNDGGITYGRTASIGVDAITN